MTDIDLQRLAIDLARADTENKFIECLSEHDLWAYDPDIWQPYGNDRTNWSNVGNQQGRAFDALAEKLTNSIDAKLQRAVKSDGIDPESDAAPQSMDEAVDQYFGIPNGNPHELDSSERADIAEGIALVASAQDGGKFPLSVSVIDNGEGQHPEDFTDTLLSLEGDNKMRIPFVQGQYSQGATGVHRFCGDHGTELIISRPAPDVQSDPRPWGFTVVRKFDPSELTDETKSPILMYLTIDGNIPEFRADEFPLLPSNTSHPNQCKREMSHGTFIKLYEYDPPTKTTFKQDPADRLNLRLPNPALPIRIYETRPYRAANNQQTLAGLRTRLTAGSAQLEDGFPGTFTMTIGDSTATGRIYALKQDCDIENYRPMVNDGIIFTVNGQTHGSFHRDFFTRAQVGLDYLKDSLIVTVSCDGLSDDDRSAMFMSDRERIVRKAEIAKRLEEEIEEELGDHDGLERLAEERQREQLQAEDDDTVTQAIRELSDDDTVAELLRGGDITQTRHKNPPGPPPLNPEFGKKFPTRFDPEETNIETPVDESVTVKFDTDASNKYFDRADSPGRVSVECNDSVDNERMSLWNGTGTLTLDPKNHGAEPTIGEHRKYKIRIEENKPRPETPFDTTVTVEFTESTDSQQNTPTEEAGLDIPQYEKVTEDEWDEKDIEFTENTAAKITWDKTADRYHFFINMGNKYLQQRINKLSADDVDEIQQQFTYGLLVMGIGHLTDAVDEHGLTEEGRVDLSNPEDNIAVEDRVSKRTSAEARVLLPLIETAGEVATGGLATL